MLFLFPARGLVGSFALAAFSAAAQTAMAPAAVAPAVGLPAPQGSQSGAYQSSFEGYQAYSDDKLVPWKESNDTVGKIGGWRVYAKEAQAPQADGGKAPAAPAAADPHAGHGKR